MCQRGVRGKFVPRRTYGTVLVDLTRCKAIDLLSDHRAETAKAWMQAHPETELVSRDRGGIMSQQLTRVLPRLFKRHIAYTAVKYYMSGKKVRPCCRAETDQRRSRDNLSTRAGVFSFGTLPSRNANRFLDKEGGSLRYPGNPALRYRP